MGGALEVGAAVIHDADGQVLIAQRSAHRPHPGRWEFPGGKLEAGETPAAGLARELAEELGIEVLASSPLLVITHRYPERTVRLHARRIDAWRGQPQAREGQALAWVAPAALPGWPVLEADRPLVDLLRLPPFLAITPDPGPDHAAFLAALERTLAGGVRFLQLRAPALAPSRYAALAAEVLARCRAAGASLLLNASPGLVDELGADGVHLNGTRLRAGGGRPLGPDRWVSASVHDAGELALAKALGVDLVLVGPVRATASHPAATALGFAGLAALAAGAGLPSYALGGLARGDLARARAAGAYGVAAVHGLWSQA